MSVHYNYNTRERRSKSPANSSVPRRSVHEDVGQTTAHGHVLDVLDHCLTIANVALEVSYSEYAFRNPLKVNIPGNYKE